VLLHGLLVLDKPQSITSRDAVDRATNWFPAKTKIGHAGTLDPLATGVLVLAVGHATRLIEYVQAMPKTYRTRITLGATSDTDDADGKIATDANAKPVDEAAIRLVLTRYVGEIDQVPPDYSAAHVSGQRAYDLARKGGVVSLSARRVRIDRIDLLSYAWPHLELEIQCGKGTYIRSIARDLGSDLGVGGYVAALRRMRIGAFAAEDAVPLNADEYMVQRRLLPMTMAVGHLPTVRVSADEARRLRMGQMIPAAESGEAMAVAESGELIAIGQIDRQWFRPRRVIPE
jgi:tRNA pseudouridine55 synthase